MKNSFTNNKQNLVVSVFLLYTLLFTLVIPIQAEKPIPANSVFSKTKTQNNQTNLAKADKSFGQTPVYFEENRGQFNKDVRYFARGTNGYSLFLTSTEAVYVVQEKGTRDKGQGTRDSDIESIQNPKSKIQNLKATAVFMKLVGANENSSSVGLEQMPHKTNYFRGNDSSKWRTNVPNFRQIQINNLYSGIDAVWKGKESGEVQYDFVVKPSANPNQIEWDIKGAESVEIDEKGDLLIKTEHGTIRQQKPFTFQENETNGLRKEVESSFKIKQNSASIRVSFELGNYDRSRILTIDPSVDLSNLSFSTLLGGNDNESGEGIAVDKAGNVYVTGETESASFPTSSGTIDTSRNGGRDVFVTKLNAAGTAIIYSTFLGGSGTDVGLAIAVDASANAYITGRTFDSTTDYPTTTGAFDETHNGAFDAFISKINSDGSSLIYSTFIGGFGNDAGRDIAIDATGNAFITGETADSVIDYPTTSGAFDEDHNGDDDVFVTKVNTSGTGLLYSTFIGGGLDDKGKAIAVDASGNAFITGDTDSTTIPLFPRTTGAFQLFGNGGTEGFVTKLNSSGSALSYSTFIGGSGDEDMRGIAVNSSGNAFVTGRSPDDTIDYPTTTGAFDETHNGGGQDVIVTKMNTDGTALDYSTFIGGNASDTGSSIAIDSSDNAYITGNTSVNTTPFPTTTGAFDETANGDTEAFATKLNPNGSALRYSTFLGGSGFDVANDIAVDDSRNVFVIGRTPNSTTNYPTTSEAFQTEHNGGSNDNFISKLGDFSISGRTIDQSGNALANTAVQMGGLQHGFMLSDSEGYYGFGDTASSGTTWVSATSTLYNFTPNTYQIDQPLLPSNYYLQFVGRPTSSGPTAAYASFGGNVRSTVGNVGLANTKLTLIDAASGNTIQVVSDSNGNYEFEGLLTGVYYLVVPQKDGYNFNPGIYEVNHLQESLSNDFLATPNSPRPVNDFDGDGKTDLAVFRPSEGNWYILESESNNVRILRFGLDGDIPVASDFDGDNKTDIAVFRPSDGNWYRINSSNGEFSAIHFGTEEDKPVQADFDGDGKTDLAVYRPSTGVWHRLMSSDGSYSAIKFGIETDIPIAADYDSDGKADLTVFRDGTWYHQMSRDNSVSIYQFGLAGDKPIRGDFDGDGRIDTSLYRPSTGVWYWIESSDSDIQAKQFGIETDIPTPSDYNGDGRYEQSVYREGIWYISNSDNSFYTAQFGKDGDVPIP